MQWRVIILLVAGISMIYFVSLLQIPPYAQPLKLQPQSSAQLLPVHPDEVILTTAHDSLYLTSLWFNTPANEPSIDPHSSNLRKSQVVGSVRQYRISHHSLSSPNTQGAWTQTVQHELPGPILKVSTPPPSSDRPTDIQLAVLYYELENESYTLIVRVYYLLQDLSVQYKDLQLPGQLWPVTFSIEDNCIIYSRDPDTHRFWVLPLPANLTSVPHSQNAERIRLTSSQPGPPIERWHQPAGTETYHGMLSRLYSKSSTFRVFVLDVHTTSLLHHINASLFDHIPHPQSTSQNLWDKRYSRYLSEDVYMDVSIEHMAYVDYAHFHHERVKINPPALPSSRSNDEKTLVTHVIKDTILTLDYSDRLDLVQSDNTEKYKVYRDTQGQTLDEFFFWSETTLNSGSDYYISDIVGLHINAEGDILVAWTDDNTVYILKRGEADRRTDDTSSSWTSDNVYESIQKSLGGKSSNSVIPMEWRIRMVIDPTEINSVPIAAAMILSKNDDTASHLPRNYLFLALQNGAILSYLLDEVQEVKIVTFYSFLRDRLEIWMPMAMIVAAFVRNERNMYAQLA
ncbi:uncharacterized protein BYT42DRAFT_575758 [Radiomyces spectabilis]|uniref:uncharacterized protein n=1 Tax=Radiomyces spectabilis TaxID=64574 RepID=UPI00221FEF16|nr:uncharacterized protein BYT42DRAFT_575758 [Radiomyces spectabilis]KAI8374269.1 hypothetical protein BYT42DRAFT_575758 [Radiomyces spectabilis]